MRHENPQFIEFMGEHLLLPNNISLFYFFKNHFIKIKGVTVITLQTN